MIVSVIVIIIVIVIVIMMLITIIVLIIVMVTIMMIPLLGSKEKQQLYVKTPGALPEPLEVPKQKDFKQR